MNLISFSLWGDNPKYTVGAIRNAELALEIYPEWICRFYIGSSVPSDIVTTLRNFKNVELVEKNKEGDWTSMYWRFEPAGEEDIDIMISRDTDSRVNMREKSAVDEWIESDKGFHIMRDHPAHGFHVLGGMWGAKRNTLPNIKELIDNFAQRDMYGTDYQFFQHIFHLIDSNKIVHDEFFDKTPFPIKRKGLEFVGEVFDEHEQNVKEHTEMLRNYLSKGI
jgi:hypothetical protein